MTEGGIVLFEHIRNIQTDAMVSGSLFNAIRSYSEVISEAGLSSFEIDNIKFSLIKHGDLLFVVSGHKELKQKRISNVLKKIAKKFSKRYDEEFFKDWDNNIVPFRSFEKEIAEVFVNSEDL